MSGETIATGLLDRAVAYGADRGLRTFDNMALFPGEEGPRYVAMELARAFLAGAIEGTSNAMRTLDSLESALKGKPEDAAPEAQT